MANLYYVHDPMCSWCYAFDAVLKQVKSQLPKSITFIKVVGGLAPDSVEPMPKAVATMVQANWNRIEQTVPHIQFNYDFWEKCKALRSTYPACRAVLAAKKQSPSFENKMIAQIQWAYYQNAENPSLDKTLINCAKEIGLNGELFVLDYNSELIEDQLHQQISFTKHLGISSYPSLCLEQKQQLYTLQIDYNNADFIMKQILKLM